MSVRLYQQEGIAVGPILFVVAILAILATAISAATGSFTQNTDSEKARTLASAIIDDAIHVRQAVMRVMALGCTDAQLNFAVSGIIAGNAAAPSDGHCDIFGRNGGGLIYTPLLSSMCSPTGCNTRHPVGVDAVPGIGTTAPELFWMSYYIDDAVCDEINRQLGFQSDTGNSSVSGSAFTGTYGLLVTFSAFYTGKEAACLRQNAAGKIFYMVLVPR